MWLLNTKSLQLEEFRSEDDVRYAILSHRWGREEVSFSDMQSLNQAKRKRGFTKVANFCETAASKGYRYGWIDTCCIDKNSSAELSEAINSMFRWYQNAAVCYVYLYDVRYSSRSSDFVRSQWFERGWTLQELLAPKRIIFFDHEWQKLGDKETLIEDIKSASGIDEIALRGASLDGFNIAQRMSWAANRRTTRLEDAAYSLMGIFDVNMPLLYGEGDKAFIRLQEQIMKNSDDRTIFWWTGFEGQVSGLLATSPSFFGNNKDVGSWDMVAMVEINRKQPHILTSRGVSLEIELFPIAYQTYAASICEGLRPHSRYAGFEDQRLELFLRKTYLSAQYERVAYRGKSRCFTPSKEKDLVQISMNLRPIPRPSVIRTINVQQHFHPSYLSKSATPFSQNVSCFKIFKPRDLRLTEVECLGTWHRENQLLKMNSTGFGTAGVLNFVPSGMHILPQNDYPCLMLLGSSIDFEPVCIVANAEGREKLKLNPRSSESRPYNLQDLSMKSINEITCMETLGWSEISNICKVEGQSGRWASEVENRPGVWAVSLLGTLSGRFFLENSRWALLIEEEMSVKREGWYWTVELTM